MYSYKLKKRGKGLLILGIWLLAASGMPLSAWAGCEANPEANFTLLVDASSSCAALSDNMVGCETDANGVCTIQNPVMGEAPIVVQVTPDNAVGSVPVPPGLVTWQVLSGPELLVGQEIDFVIGLGANQGGTCGASHSPGKPSGMGPVFKKSNDSYQKVNGLFFCSDFTAPPPGIPRLILKKTVMLENGTCSIDDVENLSLKVGMEVQYCFLVENIGIGDAFNVELSDLDVYGTTPQPGGKGGTFFLEAGDFELITSPAVTIDTQGETVNEASVTYTSADSTPEDPAIDTATVNAELALVSCPEDYQEAVDGFFNEEDDFKYAALLDPLNPDRLSICVPSDVDSNVGCVNQCILKDICKDPSSMAYDAAECEPPTGSKCEESGNWWKRDSMGTCQAPNAESPYCWEAIQDRGGNCEYKAVEPLQSLDLNIEQYHDNPFCYLSCADISDLKTCNYICF